MFKSDRIIWKVVCLFLALPMLQTVSAQTPTATATLAPPHINIVKEVETLGELCPNQIIDISITLYGEGTTAYLRKPVDVVCVLDQSGSMAVAQVPYNVNAEPPFPYGPTPTPGGSPTPAYTPNGAYRPHIDSVWAAWKLFRYLELNPPSVGYQDFGGIIFYSTAFPLGPPAQRTPGITILQGVPADPTQTKTYWWNNHLALSAPSGGTGIGPALQLARDLISTMPTHPAVTGTPAYPAAQGERFVVLLTDGRPNDYWTPYPLATPRWSTTAPLCYYDHAWHMARRLSLSAPWPPYTEAYNTTVYAIGLGTAVDTQFLRQIADPFAPEYWSGIPTPEAKHGQFFNPTNPDDLTSVFEQIASLIANQRAGTEIFVMELFADGMCPGGDTIWTDIIPGSWNTPPAGITPPATPGQGTRYTWEFGTLMIGDESRLTFQVQVDPAAPVNSVTVLECPESQITYRTYDGYYLTEPIEDPMLHIGDCDVTPLPTSTPTITPTSTSTPTCIPAQLIFENFETGFGVFDTYGPVEGIRVLSDANYAHSGINCIHFGGSLNPLGPNEAQMTGAYSFSVPQVRYGAVIDFYLSMHNFSGIWKNGNQTNDFGENLFYLIVTSSSQTLPVIFDDSYEDAYGYAWFHNQVDLSRFVNEDVTITFRSDFPITNPNPDPSSVEEPMIFLDDVQITDYCYNGTPTPTPVPPIIPTTSTAALFIMGAIFSALLLFAILKK